MARRDQGGQGTGSEQVLDGILGGLEPEQDPGQPAFHPREQKVSASVRLEARGLREGTRVRIELRAPLLPGRGGHERDRHRGAFPAARDEHLACRGLQLLHWRAVV